MVAPVITLTTDFGLADHYVASLKAVLLTRVPAAHIVDVTHLLPRQQVLPASFVLERAISCFPAGTIHLAVVDPGVGSPRRILVTEIRAQLVVCPDNGLITWPWRIHPGARAHELTWRPPVASQTFHGRDIMAPVAAQLALGNALDELARPVSDPILLDIRPATTPRGQVLHVDHFGNCTTNIPAHLIPPGAHVRAAGCDFGPLRRTYAEVPSGQLLALIGSSELLEIAANGASAAELLPLRPGDAVECVAP